MATMLSHPLKRTDWKRNKERSEDLWKRMAFSINQSTFSHGLTHLPVETLASNILKMILFNIGTMASISRKTEKIKTGAAFLIYSQTNCLME
jgi:hypothetical protein